MSVMDWNPLETLFRNMKGDYIYHTWWEWNELNHNAMAYKLLILDRGIKGTVSQESLKTKAMVGKIMSFLRAANCYDFSGNGNLW